MLKKHGVALNFSCAELHMLEHHEDISEELADPKVLAWQVITLRKSLDLHFLIIMGLLRFEPLLSLCKPCNRSHQPLPPRPIIHPAVILQSSMRVNQHVSSPHLKNVLPRPRGPFSHPYLRNAHLIEEPQFTQALHRFRHENMTNFVPWSLAHPH